jgi:hypothetical protein
MTGDQRSIADDANPRERKDGTRRQLQRCRKRKAERLEAFFDHGHAAPLLWL